MQPRITAGRVAIAAIALAAAPAAAVAAVSFTVADASTGAGAAPAVASASAAAAKTVAVRITGGHATAAHDRGRPVVLVAAALGVPTEVFRTAFDGVTPAAAGDAPDPAQVQANKAALLAVLAPYGVTNERLDAVSDHYRFQGSEGETWPRQAASATAVVRNGKVVSLKLLDGGSGYSSTPRISVPGASSASIAVTLRHGTDFATNGSIASLTVTTG
jgi:hypothetical protein